MNFNDYKALEMIKTLSMPGIIVSVVIFVLSILLALAVKYYNKSRGVRENGFIYFLIFLFGPLGALIYYLVNKNKAENIDFCENTDRNKYKIISVILAVVYAVGFVANIVVVNSGLLFNGDFYEIVSRLSTFYDRYGNEYESYEDRLYYTEDGCKFKLRTYGDGSPEFSQASDTYSSKYKESYELAFVRINENGYIVFFDEELEMDDEKFESGTPFYYVDKNGNYYAAPLNVYWNSDGEIDNIIK